MGEGGFDGELGLGEVLLLEAKVFVALGAEIMGGGTTKEATVIGAKGMTTCLLPFLLLGHDA